MKRIFYFAAMALAACAVMVSCEKEQDNKPNTDIDQPGEVTKLATPQVSVEIDGDNIVVSWEAVENAGSYSYVFNAESAQTTTETTVTRPTSDFEFGTENTVLVTAMPAEGDDAHTASNAGVASFTLSAPVPDPLEPGSMITDPSVLIGTWTVTTNRTMVWGPDPENPQYVVPVYENEPMTFDVVISADTQADDEVELLVSGWGLFESMLEEGSSCPALAGINEQYGVVLFQGGYNMGTLKDGTQLIWLSFDLNGNSFTTDLFPSYVFTMREDGTVVGSAMGIEYTDGTTSSVGSLDIFGVTTDGYLSIFCEESPAGEFTMVKKSAGAPVNARSYRSTAIYNIAPRANYVLK